MKSMLGNDKSAKFILFRSDNESLLPKRSEVKKLLGAKSASFYKPRGHYSIEISYINSVLDALNSGIHRNCELRYSFGSRNPTYMTSVLRLDSETKRNVFFDLKYSEMILDYLWLSHESLNELEMICDASCDLINRVKEVDRLIKNIDEFNNVVNRKKLIDQNVRESITLLNSDCFQKFGDEAFKHAENKLAKWYLKAKWQPET